MLTDETFLVHAAKQYDNPQCVSTEEFFEDLKRIKYVKKLVTRYSETGELKERLILNHLIVLSNVFGPEFLCRVVFLKMKNQIRYVKPFLVLLNVLPDQVRDVRKKGVIYTDEAPMDEHIVSVLRKL